MGLISRVSSRTYRFLDTHMTSRPFGPNSNNFQVGTPKTPTQNQTTINKISNQGQSIFNLQAPSIQISKSNSTSPLLTNHQTSTSDTSEKSSFYTNNSNNRINVNRKKSKINLSKNRNRSQNIVK